MKPLFKNKTKYTTKNYEQFINFHNNKYNFKYISFTLLFLIMFIYCLIVNIQKNNMLFIVMFVLIIIIFLLFRLYLPVQKYKKSQKICKSTKNPPFTFLFYNYYFTINGTRVYYFKLHKIFETEEYFYLYVDDSNAAIISKKGFIIGNSLQFSEFMKKKCLFKYNNFKGTTES